MTRYAVYEGHMEALEKKVAKIQKKCEKYGTEFHFEKVGEEYREEEHPMGGMVTVKYIIVEAEGTAQINGWEFIASVEHTPLGNIYNKGMNDVEIPEQYRCTDPFCEHCKINRTRKNTFIVRNTETGEFKQIGRACLKDYTNGMSAESASYMASIKAVFEEETTRPVSFGEGHVSNYYKTEDVLRYMAETIRHFGYVKSDNDSAIPTKTRAINYYMADNEIYRPYFKPEAFLAEMKSVGFNADSEEAKAMVEGAVNWIKGIEDPGDYEHNMQVAVALEYTKSHRFGLLASIFPAYDRELEKQAKLAEERKSEYVGEVGKRIKIDVESRTAVTSWDTMYGTTRVWKIVDKNGNIYIWKTSKYIEEETIQIIATVQGHEEYRGVKQTNVTRCKCIEKED